MNDSKLSVIAFSADVPTEQRTDNYRSAWDTVPEDHLPGNTRGRNENGVHHTVERECLDTMAVHGYSGWPILQSRSRLETKGLDRGLWLLCRSAIRQSQWEHLLEVSQSAVENGDHGTKYSRAVKRSCDIVGSLFLLTVLSPLFMLTAILIKLESPGSILFRHQRVGKDGRAFLLWKFRSMKVNVPKYAVSPQSAADARLTRIGRLIRRLSIDEMPQLINVLKGEMSLVGPRPEMPFIVESYRPMEHGRFAVRPGITGLWQISPARAFPIHENLQYDFHYIQNQNLIFDCAIMLRTITAVLHGIGAV